MIFWSGNIMKKKGKLYIAGTSRDTWLMRSPEYRRDFKRQILKDEEIGICNKCDKYYDPTELSIDHIIPISRGGPVDDIFNMQLLCRKCHNKKTKSEQI